MDGRFELSGAGGGGAATWVAVLPEIQTVKYSGFGAIPGNRSDPERVGAGDGGIYNGNSTNLGTTGLGKKGRAVIRWSASPIPFPETSDLIHGSRAAKAFTSTSSPEQLYQLVQEAYSSYEVRIDGISGTINSPASPLTLSRLDALGGVAQSGVASQSGSTISLRWQNATSTEASDEVIRVARSTSPGAGTDGTYRVRAYDTTYTISRFNNGGAAVTTGAEDCGLATGPPSIQCTVVRIFNRGVSSVSGRIHFRDEAGMLLHTETFSSLQPRTQLALESWKTAALANKKGSITVTSDAPYGILSGEAISFESPSGFAFNTPMEPRPR
jgi:hypothetical protein